IPRLKAGRHWGARPRWLTSESHPAPICEAGRGNSLRSTSAKSRCALKNPAEDMVRQFRVVFTLDNATKSKAHFQFVEPHSKEGDDIRQVLLKYKVADELYPFKASRVADLVRAGAKRKFTVH